MLPFAVSHTDPDSGARAGVLETPHGTVHTPAFMPVGTAGTVKGIAAWELARLAPEMVLANTYHLLLRPGPERLAALGGLHRLMGWDGPILTDSGGFQVFSLAANRTVEDDGVVFRSHLNGDLHRLTPTGVVETQAGFGVDVAMVLDECLPYPVEPAVAGPSVERSIRWALAGLAQARALAERWSGGVFAIQQGGLDDNLRRDCSQRLAAAAFDGYAIGGLAVGEPPAALYDAVARFAPLLPAMRPRYLMGVGYPQDLLWAVACGIDLFDCVLPTRSARTGKLFTSQGEIVIKHARWADDDSALDPECPCPTCASYSKGALRHLFVTREATSVVVLTVHNLTFFLRLMRSARDAIMAGRYTGFRHTYARALGSRTEAGAFDPNSR